MYMYVHLFFTIQYNEPGLMYTDIITYKYIDLSNNSYQHYFNNWRFGKLVFDW